jgi:hypothetical protein
MQHSLQTITKILVNAISLNGFLFFSLFLSLFGFDQTIRERVDLEGSLLSQSGIWLSLTEVKGLSLASLH